MGRAVLQVLGISKEQAEDTSSRNPVLFPWHVWASPAHWSPLPTLLCTWCNIRGASERSSFFWWLEAHDYEAAGPPTGQLANQWAWEEFLCIYFCPIPLSPSLMLSTQNETKTWSLGKSLDVNLSWSKATQSSCFPESWNKKRQLPKLWLKS